MTNEEMARRVYLGENEYIETLYIQNYAFIYKYVTAYYNKHFTRCMACGVEVDDLLNQCFFAIPMTVTAYNESNPKGYKFLTFFNYPLLNCCNELIGYNTTSKRKKPLNYCISFDTPAPGTDEALLSDTIEDITANFEERIITKVSCLGIWDAVREVLKDHELYYSVIWMRYVMELEPQEIASILKCEVSKVYNATTKGINILGHPKNKHIMAVYSDI